MSWLLNLIEYLTPCRHEWIQRGEGKLIDVYDVGLEIQRGTYEAYICKKCLKKKMVEFKR